MKWVYDDDGRSKYYQNQKVNDCICRALSISLEKDYKEIYDLINTYAEEYGKNENQEDYSNACSGLSKELTYKILSEPGYTLVMGQSGNKFVSKRIYEFVMNMLYYEVSLVIIKIYFEKDGETIQKVVEKFLIKHVR